MNPLAIFVDDRHAPSVRRLVPGDRIVLQVSRLGAADFEHNAAAFDLAT